MWHEYPSVYLWTEGVCGVDGWGPVTWPGPRSLKSSTQTRPFPHIRSKVKVSERGEEVTPAAAAAAVSFTSVWGPTVVARRTVSFLQVSFVRIKNKKYSILWRGKQLSQENIAAFFFFNLGFYKQSKHSLRDPFPSFPWCHTECKDWSEKKYTYLYLKKSCGIKTVKTQHFILETKLDYSYFVPASHHDVINMNLGENQNWFQLI